MKKFDLIDIDESTLPDVTLSDSQRKMIKERVELRLKRFLKDNSKLNIDATTDNIYKIENELGAKKHTIVHMVNHANVLRALVSEAIDKDCPLKSEEILYKIALRHGGGKEFRDVATFWANDPFYYQLYITKDKILIYTLTNNLKLMDTRELKLSDIEGVGVSNVAYTGYFITKLNNHNLIIATKKAVYPYPKEYFLVDDNPKDLTSLKEIETLLLSLGIEKFIPRKRSNTYIVINIICFLLTIASIIVCLL